VQYVNNKSAMIISKADHEESINWSKSWSNAKSVKKTRMREQLKENQKRMYAILLLSYKFCLRSGFH
jgi:hypothetical protein